MKEPQKPKASKKGSKAGAKFTGVSTHKTLTEFRLLYDNLPQKLFIKDRDSVYVSVNEKFAADLKVKPEEVAGKTDYDLFGKDFADKYRADDARIMESGKTEDIVENYIKEGEEIIVNTIKTPLKDKQGKVIGLLGAFWDITPYRRVEMQALRQNATLKAINDIFSKSMTCETEEQVGEACLSVAEKLTESAFSFIGKINPNGRFDTIALTNPGWADCKMPESEAPKLITNMEIRGIWGRVLKDGKPVIANEPKSHPDRRGVPEGHPPLTSFLGVPLKEGDRTEGMIALANKAEGYGPADQEAVEALALAVGQAVRA
ncbi:MAG: GAF domain-containing protein, partial [Thermodesulfobacteriota bacterium]|nr:GAF domain-containing protein [Thermodesulfobacteriota bacterium]